MWWIIISLLLIWVSWGKVVEWKDKTIQVRVPAYSVLTIEVPCSILNVAHLDLVKSAFSKKAKVNSVHIAVKNRPTSVGITCEKEGIIKSYNFFLIPDKRAGTTYLRVIDKQLERKVMIVKAQVKGRKGDSSILERAKVLMRAMLTGRVPFGYELLKGERTHKIGSFELRETMIWSGQLIGVVYKLKNVSPMQVKVHPSMFAGKGTILVWLERSDSEYMRPNEERILAVVFLGKLVKGKKSTASVEVLPYKER